MPKKVSRTTTIQLTDPVHPEKYKEMPILGDLYDVLIASPETKRLANILNRLVHGSAQTFSRQTNVDLDNKYTVLDISELTGDLLTVGMFVALDFVWDKAKENRAVEKAIFIDECLEADRCRQQSSCCPSMYWRFSKSSVATAARQFAPHRI